MEPRRPGPVGHPAGHDPGRRVAARYRTDVTSGAHWFALLAAVMFLASAIIVHDARDGRQAASGVVLLATPVGILLIWSVWSWSRWLRGAHLTVDGESLVLVDGGGRRRVLAARAAGAVRRVRVERGHRSAAVARPRAGPS